MACSTSPAACISDTACRAGPRSPRASPVRPVGSVSAIQAARAARSRSGASAAARCASRDASATRPHTPADSAARSSRSTRTVGSVVRSAARSPPGSPCSGRTSPWPRARVRRARQRAGRPAGGELGPPPDRAGRFTLVLGDERLEHRGRSDGAADRSTADCNSGCRRRIDRGATHSRARPAALVRPRRRGEATERAPSHPRGFLCRRAGRQRHREDREPAGWSSAAARSANSCSTPTDDRTFADPVPRRRSGELAQRERVAGGASHEVTASRSGRCPGDGVEQGVRVVVREGLQVEAPEARLGHRVGLPGRHHHDHRVLGDPPGDHAERQAEGRRPSAGPRRRRGAAPGRGVGQQGQRGQTGEERRGLLAALDPEGDVQGASLRCRQVRESRTERVQQHVERGVRLPGLGGGPRRGQDTDATAARVVHRVGDQHRLPDARLAVDDERRAAPPPRTASIAARRAAVSSARPTTGRPTDMSSVWQCSGSRRTPAVPRSEHA